MQPTADRDRTTEVNLDETKQLAESHLTRRLFGQILRRIERLTWHPT